MRMRAKTCRGARFQGFVKGVEDCADRAAKTATWPRDGDRKEAKKGENG
jgi:hypothetical protein